MEHLHIRFLRFSAFYSPMLLTMSGGHLAAEGLEATYDTVTPQRTILDGIVDGAVQVAQSATAVSFEPWQLGESLPFRHFALMNRRDGFYLARRGPGAEFDWADLEGATVIADHFFQPMAMLLCALAERGVDASSVRLIDAGDPAAIDRAFRSGEGDVVHMQGPAPHQLQHDGIATVVASVGAAAWPIAFSSLCASPEWLATDAAPAFVRAFEAAREQARSETPDRIARLIAGFLPDQHPQAISAAVADYQRMGCWDGGITIDRPLYDDTVRLFRTFGGLQCEPDYDDVVAPLPV